MCLKIGILLLAAAQVLGTAEEGQFLQRVRQLTFSGRSGEGYFSPDGRELVFQSVRQEGNPFYQIYRLDLESGEVTRVSPGIGKTTCAFFRPGSDEILFASTHHDPRAQEKQQKELEFLASGQSRRYSWDYDPEMEIYTARRDGSNLKRLTSAPGYDAEGAYSPDGTWIVFASTRHAFPLERLSERERALYQKDPAHFAELYVMRADGSELRRLTHRPGYDGGPFFMPDGQSVVWRSFETNGLVADIFTMNLRERKPTQITRFESMSWAPFPHPSGRYIIFTSNKHGFENFELFLVDAEGRKSPVRVTTTPGFDGLPVFSPDGRKLCWTSNRTGDGESQLFLAEWNHSAALAALGLDGDQNDDRVLTRTADNASKLSAEIQASDARVHVNFLASDELEGRQTATAGAQRAADYIAAQLRSNGALPFGTNGTYFQTFEFTAGLEAIPEKCKLSLTVQNQRQSFQLEKDFRPLGFSSNGDCEAPVVFGGYGLVVPGKAGENYDSYAGLDVTNKIVMVLRYVPEDIAPERRQELNRYAALRYKAMIAREKGAKAILFVTGPNSPNSGELIPLSSDGAGASSDILALSITASVAEAILQRPLKEVQSALDQEDPHSPKSFALQGVQAGVQVHLERQKQIDRNVIGVIPPKGQTKEYVMVGAHYDHLGRGDTGGSRQHGAEQGEIHNGADDNASGVAAVLELAGKMAAELPNSSGERRGIIFGFWSGEEMGLLGSSRFAENPPVALTNIVAYLNFDMIGRLRDNKLTLQGAGSSPIWRKLIEKRNISAGFNLVVQDDPYLPTDTTAFYPKGIPVLSFFTSSHDDYHRPTDDAEKVNYDGIEGITQFAHGLLADMIKPATRPEYLRVDSSASGGNRERLRVFLGTVPDYSSEEKGVKISGVLPGSPAEKAGLQGGDVIIRFAGQKISNIYDYTYALDAAKIGEPVEVGIERKGKELNISVTPQARK